MYSQPVVSQLRRGVKHLSAVTLHLPAMHGPSAHVKFLLSHRPVVSLQELGVHSVLLHTMGMYSHSPFALQESLVHFFPSSHLRGVYWQAPVVALQDVIEQSLSVQVSILLTRAQVPDVVLQNLWLHGVLSLSPQSNFGVSLHLPSLESHWLFMQGLLGVHVLGEEVHPVSGLQP